MKNKEHRMIYVVGDKEYKQIKEMKENHHLNISSLIRGFLEQKYQEFKKNEDNKVN